jgi:cellulose synthase/poly-beta-1,6-N-acetylglucosamine synthase-like glycosyltransferase
MEVGRTLTFVALSFQVSTSRSTSLMSITNSSTTAIIPAHNEAGRIGPVLKALIQVDCLGEIIVIDDGSTDHTVDEVKSC